MARISAVAWRLLFPGADIMRISLLFASLIVAASALGCEAEPPPRAPLAPASREVEGEISRSAAVDMARSDAARRFRELGGISFVNAEALGKYWVVELHAAGGQGVRYAIARNGGAVKERTLIR